MQTTKEQIAGELKRILAEDLFVEIPPDRIKETDSLTTDIGLDSVGQIELVSIVEEKYGFRVDASKATAEMKTVGDAAEFVWNNMNGASRETGVPEQKPA